MNQGLKFWNKMSSKYASQPIADEAAYQHKLEETKKYYDKNTSILEIGCATGGTAIKHAPNVKHYTAIDYCEPLLNVGIQQAKQKGIDNIQFVQTGIDDFEIKKDQYEMVLALSVFHLLPNYTEVIQKIYHSLPKDAVLISSTTCLKQQSKILQWILPIMTKLGVAPLVMKFSCDELVEQFEKVGFKIEYKWQPHEKAALFIVAKKVNSV
ncbi:class I SAM-dependent methyltransferase [Marinicellulosiphila megalodicopiae]|uniref:class I SAM-dependent methyltransferase n=1 Tax=Marinicellulosiphila megalodicopiae TaxID=2724896 RepID=UPI003BAF3865